MAYTPVVSNMTVSGELIADSARQEVLNGGVAVDCTVMTSGTQYVESGGIASGTRIDSGGRLYLGPGGSAHGVVASGYTVTENGYTWIVKSEISTDRGLLSSVKVYEYADLTVHESSWADDVHVYGGGSASIYGNATDVTIYEGGQLTASLGNIDGLTLSSGARLILSTDVTIQNAQVFSVHGETSGSMAAFSISGGVAHNVHLYNGTSLTVFSGHTASGSVISGGSLETISSGGIACDTTLLSDGKQVVTSGGTASRVFVKSYGRVVVENGGVLDEVTLSSEGRLTLSEGGVVRNGTNSRTDGHSRFSLENGVASNFYLQHGCSLSLTSGQSAVNTVVSGGTLVLSGAVQVDGLNIVLWGNVQLDTAATVSSATYTRYDSQTTSFSLSGGVASGFVLTNRGSLTVLSGHSALNTVVSSYAGLAVADGGYASGIYLETYARLNADTGATILNASAQTSDGYRHFSIESGTASGFVVESGASLTIQSGHSALQTRVEYRGTLTALGGTLDSLEVNDGAIVHLNTSATITNATVVRNNSRCAFSIKSGVASGVTLYSSGSFVVQSGHSAVDTWIHGWSYPGITVACGGYASGTVVSSSMITVEGRTENTTLHEATVSVRSNGAMSGTAARSNNYITVDNGAVTQTTLGTNTTLNLYNGGTATDTTLHHDAFFIVSYGGKAVNTRVESSGQATIYAGGSMDGLQIDSGGKLSVTLYSDQLENTHIKNGTNARTDGFSSFSLSGGILRNVLLENQGRAEIYGGCAANTLVSSGGFLHVYDAGTLKDAVMIDGGTLSGDMDIDADATLRLGSNAQLKDAVIRVNAGNIRISGTGNSLGTLHFAPDAGVTFDITGSLGNDMSPMVDNAVLLTTPHFRINVNPHNTRSGVYRLAGNAADFSATVSLYAEDTLLGTVNRNTPFIDSQTGCTYSLTVNQNVELELAVTPAGFYVTESSVPAGSLKPGLAEVRLTFSDVPNSTTLTNDAVYLQDKNGNRVAASILQDGRMVTLVFADPLAAEGQYTLHVSNALRSQGGHAFDQTDADNNFDELGNFVQAFVVDGTAPAVLSVVNPDTDANVLRQLQVTFSEPMNMATLRQTVRLLNPGQFSITPESVRDMGNGVYEFMFSEQRTHGAYTLAVYPSLKNANGKTYECTDLAGNLLAVKSQTPLVLIAADLSIVKHTLTSDTVTPGQVLTVNWSTRTPDNKMPAGSWTDGLYLSKDNNWDSTDLLLSEYTRTGPISGEAYDCTMQAVLPAVMEGDWHLLLRADIQQSMEPEGVPTRENNMVAVPVTMQIQKISRTEPARGDMPSEGLACYQFKQTANEAHSLQLNTTSSLNGMNVYVGYGFIPTEDDHSLSAYTYGGSIPLPNIAIDATAYVVVKASYAAENITYTLGLSTSSSMRLTSLSHTIQSTKVPFVLDVAGENFTQDMQILFRSDDGKVYTPDALQPLSAKRVRVQFESGAIPVGQYHIELKNSEELLATSYRFAVTDNPGGQFEGRLQSPWRVGYHLVSTLDFSYHNAGFAPMEAPLVIVSAEQNGAPGAIMTLDKSRVSDGFWTSGMPKGFSNSVQFLASGALGNLLAPDPDKENAFSTSIYYTGWQQPWDSNYSLINFTAKYITVDNPTQLDWNSALSKYTLSSAYKEALAENLYVQVGDTWGDYVRMLNENLGYLDTHELIDMPVPGKNSLAINNDVLFHFEMLQAGGKLSPVSELETRIDVVATTQDGSGTIVFSRSFAADMESRLTTGMFGPGWRTNWDVYMEWRSNVDMVFHDETGNTWTFQPDYRGGFQDVHAYGGEIREDGTSIILTKGDTVLTFRTVDGKLVSRTDTTGTVFCEYDEQGRLQRLRMDENTYIDFTRSTQGTLSAAKSSAGTRVDYEYDASGRLVAAETTTNGLTSSTAYTYSDAVNNALTQIQSLGDNTTFGYDERGILSSVTENGLVRSFSYDPCGTVSVSIHREDISEEVLDEGDNPAGPVPVSVGDYCFDQYGYVVKTQANGVRGGIVAGFAVNAAGEALPNALLELYRVTAKTDPATSSQARVVHSDSDGYFQFSGLDAGTYILRNADDTLGNTAKTVTISDNSMLLDTFTMVLAENHVAVLLPSSTDNAEAVTAILIEAATGKRHIGLLDTGRADFYDLPEGEYLLHIAQGDNAASQAVAVPALGSVAVTAPEPLATGTVSCKIQGVAAKAESAYIRLLRDEIPLYSAFFSTGLASLSGIEPGIYTAELYFGSAASPNQVLSVTVTNSTESQVQFVQAIYGSVTGVLSNGTDVFADVAVTLSRDGFSATIRTDADGSYLFESLNPGDYELQIAGYDGVSEHISVGNTTHVQADIVLKDATVLSGTLFAPDTQNADGTVLLFYDGRPLHSVETINGDYSVFIPDSTVLYDLFVVSEEGFAYKTEITINNSHRCDISLSKPAASFLNHETPLTRPADLPKNARALSKPAGNPFGLSNGLGNVKDHILLSIWKEEQKEFMESEGRIFQKITNNNLGIRVNEYVDCKACIVDFQAYNEALSRMLAMQNSIGESKIVVQKSLETVVTNTSNAIRDMGLLFLGVQSAIPEIATILLFHDVFSLVSTVADGVVSQFFNAAKDLKSSLTSTGEKISQIQEQMWDETDGLSFVSVLNGINGIAIQNELATLQKRLDSFDELNKKFFDNFEALVDALERKQIIRNTRGFVTSLKSACEGLGTICSGILLGLSFREAVESIVATNRIMNLHASTLISCERLVDQLIDRSNDLHHYPWHTSPPLTSFGDIDPAPLPPVGAPLEGGSTSPALPEDPNDILGPAGYGEKGYLTGKEPLSYMVRFENKADAAAPARWIRVMNTMDEAFDLGSLRLHELVLGGQLIDLGDAAGNLKKSAAIEVQGETGKEIVQIEISIKMDRTARTLSVSLMAIDPDTGWMEQTPDKGLLFPNNELGRGDGYLAYSITPASGLSSGTELKNQAAIYFDFNDPIDTPTIRNTVDVDAPTATVLSAVQGQNRSSIAPVTVKWEGTDTGAGVGSYNVWYCVDGGEKLRWLYHTNQTSAVFTPTVAGAYTFFARAADNVGNVGVLSAGTGVTVENPGGGGGTNPPTPPVNPPVPPVDPPVTPPVDPPVDPTPPVDPPVPPVTPPVDPSLPVPGILSHQIPGNNSVVLGWSSPSNLPEGVTALAGYELLLGKTTIFVGSGVTSLEILNLSDGETHWQVRALYDSDSGQKYSPWAEPNTALVVSGNAPGTPRMVRGTPGHDLMVVQIDGDWNADYVARNVNTGELRELSGWKRSFDAFNGQNGGHDVLLLRESRTALFLDDIYSPADPAMSGTRLDHVTEIRGTGETFIDLTSTRWQAGDTLLRAGNGNSVLWAGNGNDLVLGGTANDQLHGGAGDDLLYGGGGNDIMDGGGGKNTFVLTPDSSGQSIVRQSAENGEKSSMTLLFTGGLTAEDLVFRQEGNDAVITRASSSRAVEPDWQVTAQNWYAPDVANRLVFGDPALTAAIDALTSSAAVGQAAQNSLDDLKNRLQGALASA